LKTLTNQQSTGYRLSVIIAFTIFHYNQHTLGRLMNTRMKSFLLVIFCSFFLILSFTSSFAGPTNPDENVMDNSDEILVDSVDNPGTMMETSDNSTTSDTDDMEEPPDVNSESAVYYTVKKGDTLWDLSKRFNNSAWKWPGLWSENKNLTNPHLIYPGQKIKLFYRSDMDQLRKLEKKAAEEKVTQETVDVAPEVVEPEETNKVVESVEPVEITDTGESKDEAGSNIQLPFFHYSKIGSIGFMTKKPAVSHGEIFKIKGSDKLMLGQGDEVFIKETNDKTLIPGAKYFCYELVPTKEVIQQIKTEAHLFDIQKKPKKVTVGNQHRITGVIQITSKKSGYAVGTIIQSYRTIYLGNELIPYVYRSPDITLTASVEGLSGLIICSEEIEGQFGDDKIAFIDKGSADGVKEGQMYNVYYSEEKDSPELIGGKKLYVPVDFASFLVLLTEENTSTVLITSAYQGITSGDAWHYPEN
jgi:hypothetical protein